MFKTLAVPVERGAFSSGRGISLPRPSSTEEMDRAVTTVAEAAHRFSLLGIDSRIALINAIQRGFLKIARPSVRAGCRAKGIVPGTPLEGEEWATGPVPVIRHLRLLRETMVSLRTTGRPPIGPVSVLPDGRTTVGVFPGNNLDRSLFRGARVEVRMEAGVTGEDVLERSASFYRRKGEGGKVVLILGGGNVASIPVMDVLCKLFNEGKVCLLKMNPINSYLGPFFEEAFARAIEDGFLSILYGGPEEGSYLCRHRGVDEIHLTGSDRTHNQIVWGDPGPVREERMLAGTPLLSKKMTSELGNVSPVIVVPGPYSDREITYQAEDLVGAATMNASFLCNSAKVLVMPRRWKLRVPFIRHIESIFAHVPSRLAYNPESTELWSRLSLGRNWLRNFGDSGAGRLPWALLTWLDPDDGEEAVFGGESFCPLLTETSLGGEDPLEFLDLAVNFVNERLWGTLSSTIVVHPRLLADPVTAAAVEKAIARLRYGTVAVNSFPGVSYALCSPPWGAFPGSTAADIQSGRGWVHNTSMLESVEKTIYRHRLTTFPRPPYFPGRRNFRTLMRRMAALERSYSWTRAPGVFIAALEA